MVGKGLEVGDGTRSVDLGLACGLHCTAWRSLDPSEHEREPGEVVAFGPRRGAAQAQYGDLLPAGGFPGTRAWGGACGRVGYTATPRRAAQQPRLAASRALVSTGGVAGRHGVALDKVH